MARTQPLRVIRPNSRKPLKESKVVPVPVEKTEEKANIVESKAEPQQAKPEEDKGKENNIWSEWLWSDGGFYYRARRDVNDVWKYEYTDANVPTPTIQYPSVREEARRYLSTAVEYPKQDEKVIYITEKNEYEVSPTGQCFYKVKAVCEEVSLTSSPNPPEQDASSDKEEVQKPTPEPVEALKTDKPVEVAKKQSDMKVGVSRVDGWISDVDLALQRGKDRDKKESETLKVTDTKKEKHSKSREMRHHQRRERKR